LLAINFITSILWLLKMMMLF